MLSKVRGLRYPDEYVIKSFFKYNLHKNKATVIELGCGDGNNLMMFREFGWNVVGIDNNKSKIYNARKNLNLIKKKKSIDFILQNLNLGIGKKAQQLNHNYRAILIPSSLYYLTRCSARKVLVDLQKIIKPGAFIFTRTRSKKDYRYGKGTKKEKNGYILNIKETGEYGLLNVFYSQSEILKMLSDYLNLDLKTATVCNVSHENMQCGKKILNSDIIISGRSLGK